MKHQTINTPRQLDRFCDAIWEEPFIAFDTEFVSEDQYRPELGLIQVAAGDLLAVIDPIELGDTTAFWDVLTEGDALVIAHAAREEIRFNHRFTGGPIRYLFDTQIAAGFVGLEYPASLANLTQTLVGKTLPKGETRTDWRKRPLTEAQITYALADVTDLEEMQGILQRQIDKLGRDDWVIEETDRLQDKVLDAETRNNWRKVSGSSNLKPRQQAIVRELWSWREAIAKERDRLPRRILRDDLVVELAKRGSTDLKRIGGIRGMERRNLIPHFPEIADAIGRAMELGDDDLPKRSPGRAKSVSPMLAQFLSTSIACISRQHGLSPAIVGNSDDVKELLAYELAPRRGSDKPALMRGWRGEIVGKQFRRILAGELAIRVADTSQAQPLEFFECG